MAKRGNLKKVMGEAATKGIKTTLEKGIPVLIPWILKSLADWWNSIEATPPPGSSKSGSATSEEPQPAEPGAAGQTTDVSKSSKSTKSDS